MERRSQVVDSLSFTDVKMDEAFWSPRIETGGNHLIYNPPRSSRDQDVERTRYRPH